MRAKLRIAFPPKGMTARRLLMNFLACLSLESGADVRLGPDQAIVEARTEKDITDVVNTTLVKIGTDLEGILVSKWDFPIISRNDRDWFFPKLGKKPEKGHTFCRVTIEILKEANLSWRELSRDLGIVQSTPTRISLGRDANIPFPQPFLYERYQARYEFLRGRGGGKIDFRATKAWMHFLLAGFAAGYCGFFRQPDELVVAFIPEATLASVLENEGARKLILEEGGLFPVVRRLALPPRPAIAYMLYVACEFALTTSLTRDFIRNMVAQVSSLLEVDRISLAGQVFTLVERVSMDFSPLLNALATLHESSIRWIRGKCHRALIGSRGVTEHYGDYAKLTTLLFQALMGAADPIGVCYYALREIAEHEAEEEARRAGARAMHVRLEKLRDEGKKVRFLLRDLRRL